MAKKHNTGWLALQIFKLWLKGWRQVPGYTVAKHETGDEVYFAVLLERPRS